MSDIDESFARLRSAAWVATPQIAAANDATCKFQAFDSGNGTFVYDEYSVVISSMPPNLTAEDYLLEFAWDPNAAVNSGLFNVINVFRKRTKTSPRVGDIYDIDIVGPDNGSVVLVAASDGFGAVSGDGWFDVQTVANDKYGSHPESGAREFGFEYVAGGVKFYTRGVSSPSNWASGLAGSVPQESGWTAMMKGIGSAITYRGGLPRPNSFSKVKYKGTH